MKTPAGLSLASQMSSLAAIQSYSAASEMDLRAVGALAPHLPPDFETSLAAAARRTAGDSEESASLARALGNAYQAAIPEVAQAVQSRAKQVALSVAYGQMEGPELGAAAAQLERFGVYGPLVQDKSAIVRHMAAQQAIGRAQSIAADFLRRTRAAEDRPDAAPDEVVAQPSPMGGQRHVPEAWKLGAYQKASGAKPSGQGDPAEKLEPPSPEPEPRSSDRTESARQQKPRFEEPRFKSADYSSSAQRIKPPPSAAPEPQPTNRGASVQRQAPAAPRPDPLSSDFYERLGANRGMSQTEIKSAYRKASMLYHPDRYSDQRAEAIKALTVAFQRIQEAYQTLSDPKKRADYDRKLPKTSFPRR
ncbi:MAG: J domain-containing protein [Elusimicrobia bacterium]|nr:J domain-containing protein [Elusimicrobiota bacterium]